MQASAYVYELEGQTFEARSFGKSKVNFWSSLHMLPQLFSMFTLMFMFTQLFTFLKKVMCIQNTTLNYEYIQIENIPLHLSLGGYLDSVAIIKRLMLQIVATLWQLGHL